MNKEKTELIYLWIEQDERGCFRNMGFNFSPCYKVNFNHRTRELTAQKLDRLNVFSEPKIFVCQIASMVLVQAETE